MDPLSKVTPDQLDLLLMVRDGIDEASFELNTGVNEKATRKALEGALGQYLAWHYNSVEMSRWLMPTAAGKEIIEAWDRREEGAARAAYEREHRYDAEVLF